MQRLTIHLKWPKLIRTQAAKPVYFQYNQRYLHNLNHNKNYLLLNNYSNRNPIINHKYFLHLSSRLSKEPESKVDKAVDILDISAKKDATSLDADTNNKDGKPAQMSSIVPRPSLWGRVVNELKHYYTGFKLLYLETKITFRLLRQVLNGHTLTRRERKQLTQTAADLFRLVPFSLFIIVPFLEFTLPIFLKLFPNMLPSTFKEESKEQEKLKKKLKAKLEMAKFLQDTLEETALVGNEKQPKEETLNYKFAEFMKKVRSKGVQPTTEEILKYSSLFENELTLDNLTRAQLIALCQILEVSTYGNIPPNDVLRFQLRMKMRSLEADDRMIINEGGVHSLNSIELQQACRERGMRSMGVSETRLRTQLEQWLDLHMNHKIPISLLILSRALYLPENLPPEELIKSTISALPNQIESATLLKIAEASGSKVDNIVKLELLKRQEEELKAEREELKKIKPVAEPIIKEATPEEAELSLSSAKEKLIDQAEVLKDKAAQLEIKESQELLTPEEIKNLGEIIENISVSPEKQVKEDINELKQDVIEYKLDLQQVEKLTQTEQHSKLTETKSAKILSKRVEKLIKDLDKLVLQLQTDEQSKIPESQQTKNMVSIDEIIAAIRQLQGVSGDVKEKKIAKILESLDKDNDGKIDDLNDVIKVFELIAAENVKVNKDQLGKILILLEKEKVLELEEQQKILDNNVQNKKEEQTQNQQQQP